jgi:hypothetical protein
MARSEMQPAQFRDALPSTDGSFEEKGTRSRGRTDIGPRGEKERGSNAYILRGGGRDAVPGTQEEDIAHVPVASREIYVDR